MNKINVLYQNLNFKSGGFGLNENLDVPLFASDETLTDLLKKASISNYDKYKKDGKNVSSTKVSSNFQKHPRYFTDESIVSTDKSLDSAPDKQNIDSVIRKVTFKRHVKLETSDESLLKNLQPCKIINTNVNIPNLKLKDLENIEEIDEIKPKKMTKSEIKEDFLGVKIKAHLIKICAWMQEIRSTIQSGASLVDSSEDYYRRERRVVEFASRFSRNYLYQLSRQLIELRRHSQKTHSTPRPGAPTPGRSLTNACQTVLQGVQAYCNHLPTTLTMPASRNTGSVHGKFYELLKDTCDFCRIVKKMGCTYYDIANSFGLIEDIETNSKSLMTLIQETLMKKTVIPPKAVPQPKKKLGDQKHGYDVPFHKRSPLESRLSMYSVAFKKTQKGNPNWKKTAEKMAKQRFSNVPSRYKNPPKQLPVGPASIETKRPSLAVKRLSHVSDSTSQLSTEPVKINEDDIPTMVQQDTKHQLDVVPVAGGMRSRLEPLLKSLVAEVSAGKEEDFLGQGVCEDMLSKLRDLLDKVQRPTQKPSPEKIKQQKFDAKHRISVFGPRNAKLICIKDKSLFESKTEIKTSKTLLTETTKQPKSLSVLPFLERNTSRRMVADCKTEAIANLPKQFTINIIQYKIDFHKYTKPLMMYRKSSQVLPWILTGKITDSLFHHLMISVLSEINIDGLADKMYRSEFETSC